jgi:hypothetical protein
MYRGVLDQGLASPGAESLEVMLMTEDEIPWDSLAFPVIIETLKLYYEDRRSGGFTTHYGEIIKLDQKKIRIEHY